MGTVFILLAYLIFFLEIIWFFTCTDHSKIPLIVPLLVIIFGLIPGFNCIIALIIPLTAAILIEEEDITLKNNWFNRTFLAYHEQ